MPGGKNKNYCSSILLEIEILNELHLDEKDEHINIFISELDCRSLGTSQVVDVGKQIQVVDCTIYHYCITFIE